MPGREGVAIPSGATAFALQLRLLGLAADPMQLRQRYGHGFGLPEILRSAKELGVRARLVSTRWERLAFTPLPAIAPLKDGRFLVIGKFRDGRILVQDPNAATPENLDRAQLEAIWTGRLILVARRAGLTDLSRRFDVTWFFGAIYKYRRDLFNVLAASFSLQVIALVTPIFFQIVTDKVLAHRGYSTLDVLTFAILIVSLFEAVLGGLRTYIFAHTANRIDVELGARLFRHLLALPIGYFQTRRTGDSVARVRELENIRTFLTSSAMTLTIDLFFTVVFLAVMVLYSFQLTLIVLAAFPLYIGISAGFTPLFRRRLEEKFNRGAENQAFLVETVTGVETLKSMAVEPQMQRRWEEQLAAYVRSSFSVTRLGNWATQSVQLINRIVMILTIYFGAHLVIEGGLTIGELIAFNILASRIAQPVLRLAQMWQDFHQTRVSVARLGDVLNAQPEPVVDPRRVTLPSIEGHILFDHVTFRYRIGAPEVLHDVCLRIPAGKIVGIVGPSGSGKSTMAKLVQRLHVPDSGRVLIDGVDLAMIDVSALRRQTAVVLQENILFDMSIRDNIALADPSVPMEPIIEAARLAGAHDFILQLPDGYDTPVGERGTTLSGGQRQRIAIARALLTDPRILILDEATSALDYESERVIRDNMRRITAGRTTLIIAPRLSMVRFADLIATIEGGRLAEQGTHEELLRAGGRYAALCRLQAGIHGVG
jgi:subfamily B ATP-binding cassette protein HlyB/CyaB